MTSRLNAAGHVVLLSVYFLAALLFSGISLADVVETNDGRTIEGKIIVNDGKIVKIQTSLGVIEVARSIVTKIEKKATPEEEFETRRKAASSADAFADLGAWAKEKGLQKQSKLAFESAVSLDPQHERANRALGRVRDEKDWVTPEEKKLRVAAREKAELEARGLVEYQGRWVSKEERDALEKGLVRVGDRWLPEIEAKRLEGLQKHGGAWINATEVPFRIRNEEFKKALGAKQWEHVITGHFSIAGVYPADFIKQVAEGGEKALTFVDKLYGGEGSGKVILAGIPASPWTYPAGMPEFIVKSPIRCELLLLAGEQEYEKAIARSETESKEVLWPGWGDFARRVYGYFVFEPVGISVVVQKDRVADALIGHTMHHIGHLLANRHDHGHTLMPPWIDEAIAALSEDAALGGVSMLCVLGETRGTGVGESKRRETIRSWREELKQNLAANKPLPLAAIVQRDLDTLSVPDVQKSMSIIEFLGARDPKAFDKFVKQIRKLVKLNRVPPDAKAFHDKCLRDAFGLDVAAVEVEWQKWIRAK